MIKTIKFCLSKLVGHEAETVYYKIVFKIPKYWFSFFPLDFLLRICNPTYSIIGKLSLN